MNNKKYLFLFSILIICSILILSFQNLSVPNLELKHVNLYNPYFPDIKPDNLALNSSYKVAPPANEYRVLKGDFTYIAFSVLSPFAQSIQIEHSLTGVDAITASLINDSIIIYKAMDVKIEGNTRGACSCQAGQVAVNNALSKLICVPEAERANYTESLYCPNEEQSSNIQSDLIREAPFYVKDPLFPAYEEVIQFGSNRTEIFIVRAKAPTVATQGLYHLTVSLKGAGQTVKVPIRVENITLGGAFDLDSSHWFSVDPRDLINASSV